MKPVSILFAIYFTCAIRAQCDPWKQLTVSLKQRLLEDHNKLRARHGVENLEWSEANDEDAVDRITRDWKNLEDPYPTTALGPPWLVKYEENGGSAYFNTSDDFVGLAANISEFVTNAWYFEIVNIDDWDNVDEIQPDIKHLANMLWKSTEYVAIGAKIDAVGPISGIARVVCFYSPKHEGSVKDNVLPPVKDDVVSIKENVLLIEDDAFPVEAQMAGSTDAMETDPAIDKPVKVVFARVRSKIENTGISWNVADISKFWNDVRSYIAGIFTF